MAQTLLAEIRNLAAAKGFDLVGVVDAERFDACQSAGRRIGDLMARCDTAVVVGSSGVKLDDHTVQLGLECLVARLQEASRRVRAIGCSRHKLSFARLADAAGFGTVSPVTGMLLHPEFGPWVRVHDVLLLEGRPFGQVHDASISDQFQPCCKCDGQPCLEPRPATDQTDTDRGQLDPAQLDPAMGCPVGAKHKATDAALQWPAPVPMSKVTRVAFNALRLVPQRFMALRFFRR